MKKRTRRPALGPALAQEPNVRPVSQVAFSGPIPFGAGFSNGYNAAEWSRDRGYVYFPELDTRRELTSYTRTEILRRVRYLSANVGFARRVLHGIPRMVAGTGLMPRFRTSDKEWNELALKNFDDRVGSAAIYDLGGRFNFYNAQAMQLHIRYRDGDGGLVLTESAAGLARVALYEAHRMGSGDTKDDPVDSVFDGVGVDKNNAARFYRLLGTDNTQVDVPVEDFIFLGKYESPGQHRCSSILKHAVNHLLDWTEINAALKSGIKLANRVGYFISKEAVAGGANVPGLVKRNPGGVDTTQTNSLGQKVRVERVFDSAGGEIPDLPPGQNIKQLLDERPHPNSLGFFEHLARDMSWGVDLSPEILWNIAALGGANTRLVLADAQSFVEQEQQFLIDTSLGRQLLYFTAKDMKAGRLRRCQDPAWWTHDWIPPARWTVDYGRDGKLHMEQMRSAALSFRRFYGWQGLDAKSELLEILDERAFLKDEAAKRGLTLADVFVSSNSAAAAGPAANPGPSDQPPGENSDTASQ